MRILASALGLVLMTGCPSTSVYRTADPIEPGSYQVGGATSIGGISDEAQETRSATGQTELMLRYGVIENLDLGLKLFVPGVEVNATYRVHRGNLWSWALLPSLSWVRSKESSATVDAINAFASLGGVASRPLGDKWHIGFGVYSGYGLYWPETGGRGHGVWVGSFALADYQLRDRWHLTPELSMYKVVSGQVPVTGGAMQTGIALRVDL